MHSVHVAFVLEQTLGHVTHAQNMRAALDEQADIRATWLPIEFDVTGAARLVPLLRSNWSIRASWRARLALRRALAAAQHDALVFHTQVTSLFSTDLMQRYPSVISLDATPINYDSVGEAYGHAAASSSFLDQQKYALNRRAFRAAHTLVAWSEWARRSLVDDYGVAPEAIHVLAPGAHRRYFELGQQRAARPRRPGPTRLLFVGGDFVRKGGPSLIEVARDLPDCEVHIVTKAAIDPQGAPNVYVHLGIGPNSPALFALFEAADVFVLPTRAECLAVVLMEAAAAGLPVVTTDVGALAEAVEPGRSGYLLSADNPHPLRTAIEALIADPGKRMRMGQAGLALARRKFDAARNNLTYLQLVRQAADTGRALARTA